LAPLKSQAEYHCEFLEHHNCYNTPNQNNHYIIIALVYATLIKHFSQEILGQLHQERQHQGGK